MAVTTSATAAPPPRCALAALPTPLVRAVRLERALGYGPLLVKRDDLTGFGVAGNKVRALEVLTGAARRDACDVLVTGGGPGSNFCQAAALAAAATGVDCELVLAGTSLPAPLPANLALALCAGARVRVTGDDDRASVDAAVEARARELRDAGRRPYAVPRGGSTGTGAVGFALAVAELEAQLQTAGVTSEDAPPTVVLPVGSAGSVAGLLAGTALRGLRWRVLGVSVSRPRDETRARVRDLATACAAELGVPAPTSVLDPLTLVDGRGPGFGVPSAENFADADLALATEGLLLDPTYTMKAFTALRHHVARAATPASAADPASPVVFWHTGGLAPALASAVARAPVPTEVPG